MSAAWSTCGSGNGTDHLNEDTSVEISITGAILSVMTLMVLVAVVALKAMTWVVDLEDRLDRAEDRVREIEGEIKGEGK